MALTFSFVLVWVCRFILRCTENNQIVLMGNGGIVEDVVSVVVGSIQYNQCLLRLLNPLMS